MEHLNPKTEGGTFQGMRASLRIGNRVVAIFVCLAIIATCYVVSLHYKDRMDARRSSPSGHSNRDAYPDLSNKGAPPSSPPAAPSIPKQSQLPSRATPLHDAGPPSELSESETDLESVVAWDLPQQRSTAPQREAALPSVDNIASAVAGAPGNGLGEQRAEETRPSIITTPEVHIEQSAPLDPAPSRKPRRSEPPSRREAGPTLFDFLWGPPPRRSAEAPRVFGWRGIGREPPPPGLYHWPWEDHTWSPHAPDTIPWAISPGDETRCRLGNCY